MRKFISYIRELIIFIFVVIMLTLIVVCGDYIEIIIYPHIISYSIVSLIVFSIFFPCRHIIIIGVTAIVDCVFKKKCETNAVFREVRRNYGSVFTDKFTGESARSSKCDIRYTYIFCKNKSIFHFKSTENYDLVPTKKYRIIYGRFSKIILSIEEA